MHLRKYRVTIGRSAANELVVVDQFNTKMISAQHAVLLHVGPGAVIIDTSLNGTYVNCRRVSRAVVKCNDTIRFGKTRIRREVLNPFSFIFTTKTVHTIPVSPVGLSITPKFQQLRDSLLCPICKNFLVFPAELSPCGHLCCSECVEKLTLTESSGSCLVCGSPLNSFKLRVKYNLTSIVEKAAKIVLNPLEFAEYNERFSRRKADLVERHSLLEQLKQKQAQVEFSSSLNQQVMDPFLLICQTWTAYEKLKFQRGIAKFPIGEGRELFCWMVRLTEHWVRYDANETDVSVALYNLNLLQDKLDRNFNESKEALIRFIYGKKLLP